MLEKSEQKPDRLVFNNMNQLVLYYGEVEVRLGNDENMDEKMNRLSGIYAPFEGMEGILHLENITEDTTGVVFDNAAAEEEEEEQEGENQDPSSQSETTTPPAGILTQEENQEGEEQNNEDEPEENTGEEEEFDDSQLEYSDGTDARESKSGANPGRIEKEN